MRNWWSTECRPPQWSRRLWWFARLRAWANIMPHGQNASTFCRLPIAEKTPTFRVFSISYGEMDLGFCSYCGALLGHHIYATTGGWKETCNIKRNIRYGVRVGIGCAYNVELMLMCFDGRRLHFQMRTAVELWRVLWQSYLYTRYVGRSTHQCSLRARMCV